VRIEQSPLLRREYPHRQGVASLEGSRLGRRLMLRQDGGERLGEVYLIRIQPGDASSHTPEGMRHRFVFSHNAPSEEAHDPGPRRIVSVGRRGPVEIQSDVLKGVSGRKSYQTANHRHIDQTGQFMHGR